MSSNSGQILMSCRESWGYFVECWLQAAPSIRSRRLTHGLTERDRLCLLWKFSCSSTIVETSNTSKHKWSVRPSQRGQRTSAFQPGVKQLFNYFQLICSLPLDFIGHSLNYSWAIPHRWWLIVPAKNRFILQMQCSWIVNGRCFFLRVGRQNTVWCVQHVTETCERCMCRCIMVCCCSERRGGMTVVHQTDGLLEGISNRMQHNTLDYLPSVVIFSLHIRQ